MFLSPSLYVVMESSGKTDGKVTLGLHLGGFRGSKQPFDGSIGNIGQCINVNMPISSEMITSLT